MNKLSLFIFRRDLRLDDNTALIQALEQSESVIPAFIFTPEQIDHNPYRSDHCLKFMLECLEDLNQQLKNKGSKLYFFKGKPHEVVEQLVTSHAIEAVYVNRDFTPYSIHRDSLIEKTCKKHGITFKSYDDILLNPPEDTLKKDGKPYQVFTPFFLNASKLKVSQPIQNRKKNYFHGHISHTFKDEIEIDKNIKTLLPGGREHALKLIEKPPYPTRLSPYLKFNVVSVRECFFALHEHPNLIRSLYWRDFFHMIAYFFPHVFKGAFHTKYDKQKWIDNPKGFKRWCQGTTGFPIVDAGMREMNQTGYMHNRARMITASFLTKDLHIDWRMGEKYFAQTLIDYDPCVNNGNWQWVAGTGCDAQPYYRIFNPWRQQEKFDAECAYIKKWIPELKAVSAKVIHNWHDEKYHEMCPDYPAPMLDHDVEAKKALKMHQESL